MSKCKELIERFKLVEGFQSVTGKFKGMRKDVEWTVYPHSAGDTEMMIQSSKRIAKINMKTGKAVLSKAGKSSFAGLSDMMGATVVDTPKDIMTQLKDLDATGKQVRLV
jgi:hypothetical protein